MIDFARRLACTIWRALSARVRMLAIGAVLATGATLVFSSCYPGVYSFDVFPEMHYQPSHRPYAPDRLAANPLAVPITGKVVEPADFNAAAELRNPFQPSPETLQQATRLFEVNCLPCHGKAGRGDGIVATYFERAQLPKPVDFASSRTRSRTDGELFFITTNGLGNMPPFGKLLTQDERWRLVLYIRNVQNQNPAS